MNLNKQLGIVLLFLLSITSSFAAEIRDPAKFGGIAISIAMKTLEPRGIEKEIISEGWRNDYESEERMALLRKYDELICTPLEDAHQAKEWARDIYTVLISLSFLSDDFGGDTYLQLAQFHISKALSDDDSVSYLLLNEILEYWHRMKSFQYHEKKGLTAAFLGALKKMEPAYKKDAELAGKVKELKTLIKN